MDDEGKILILHRMEVKMMVAHAKYLRLPTIFGKSKKVIFSLVIDMVWKKVKGWIKQFLSKYSKEVLIKFVAQAIPTCVISCFKLPDN